jgi:hypothetical protein
MTIKKYLILPAIISSHIYAYEASPSVVHEKSNTIESMYVFNKSYIDNLNFDIIISQYGDKSSIKKTTPNFEWGEQGQISYSKKLPESIYSVLASFTALYNHFDYHTSVTPDDLSASLNVQNKYVPNINVFTSSKSEPINFRQRNQFNLYELDLFVKADLKNTKHARFAIFGGAIISGYKFKSNQNVSYYDFSNNFNYDEVYTSNTDYFLGPNAKIHVAAPFFNNHLELSLRAGCGLMMSYVSMDAFHNSYNASNQQTSHDTAGYSNTFRLSLQYDLMAQVAFCYKDFCLASGITQFSYGSIRPQNLIAFGGPYIKASYSF